MYIEGPLKSGKTSMISDKFIELVRSGIPSNEILIICANSYKKSILINIIKEKLSDNSLDQIGNIPVFTYNGIVYNSIQNNWPIIEDSILKDTDNSVIIPNLCGLETTEYVLKNCIKSVNQELKGELGFKDYYSELNLIHQLLRRYRLFTENQLNNKEINAKTVFLKENFARESELVLKKLNDKTSKIRSIDYLKQTELFIHLLENNLIDDFKNVKYLFADDVDEMSFSAQYLIKYLVPKISEYYLAADSEGGSRRGYLCAYPEGWEEIKQLHKSEIIKLTTNKPVFKDAETLFTSVQNGLSSDLEFIELNNSVKRVEMVNEVTNKLSELIIKQKVSPEDIIIVSPTIDENTKYLLSEFFKIHNIKFQFLSGSKKIIDNPYVFGSLIIAQLINKNWKFKPAEFEIRLLFTGLLNFPMVACNDIIQSYKKHKKLDENINLLSPDLDNKYKNLINTIKYLKEDACNLQDQLSVIFTRILAPELTVDSDIEDFNIMLKSLKNFYEVITKLDNTEIPDIPEKDWVIQIKNTVVSDNPPLMPNIKKDSILIATPQKVVDFELESKYQIWLDVSNNQWTKDDTGPLYNSWVFQKNWTGEEYSPEIHRKLTLKKTAHVLRKLVLCVEERIFAYSSQLDNLGNENSGVLSHSLCKNQVIEDQNFNRIIPRKDQQPILDYKGGKLAIPAVPGAGKTTVMRELIIELILKGVKPSEIMVITYMESAARNFVDRIKKNCPNLKELPYISTIHGLAYKILLDDDNFIKMGFDQNLEICDDTAKVRIIREICLKYIPVGETEYNWIELNTRAIAKAKLADLSPKAIKEYLKNKSHQQLEEFLPIYTEYARTLREKNLVDFDDLLVMSVKLLQNYPEIRRVYQMQYRYVIEDEAQDSSKIQQELISIISGYHGNLIRCGDPNQAIMNTFTNADVKGFRDFIANNPNIKMTSSQRCSKDIYDLANNLVKWSYTQNDLKYSFLEIYMEPVDSKNPQSDNAVNLNIYSSPDDEKITVLNEIRKLKEENPDFTYGILLKKNDSVVEWSRFLENHGLPVICYTDSLKQKKVFRFILSFLQVLENPWENKNIVELYEEFIQLKFYTKNFESIDFIKNKIKSPFISFELSDLETENLVNFWADIYYWLENSCIPPEELVIKLGNYYFSDITDKSNVYLMSALIKKFKAGFNDYSDTAKTINLPDVIDHFKSLRDLKRVSGVRFFTEMEEDNTALAGYVQLMTIHKAKGNEFDAVFIPEMHETMYNYPITPDVIQLKAENILLSAIEELGSNKTKIPVQNIQLEQVEENMRVIYVGITRAKSRLYMSSTVKLVNRWGKVTNNQPSKVLEYFISQKQAKSEVLING
jgi:DNA helicase-2/ATP-dependent DNA helicase PcrA